MNIKSERLKKLESELEDLEQWLRLGLVPKKDIEKHKEEIKSIQAKIKEEKERLRFMKESGEGEEAIPLKRPTPKQIYAEPQTLPDMDVNTELTDAGLDMETETFETETTIAEEHETQSEEVTLSEEEEEEDPFSDRNRWKRGIWENPDGDNG